GTLLAYEVEEQQSSVDLVMHTPATQAETAKLGELRKQRRAEIAAREAEHARQEAEHARQEAERAKHVPEDLSKYSCADLSGTGSYKNERIALHYDKLVPDPNPREGFDAEEVTGVLHDPAKFEQLYFDATHGYGKAAWLVCNFELHVQIDAKETAHAVGDVTDYRGLIHSLLGTGGYDFGKYGFSPR